MIRGAVGLVRRALGTLLLLLLLISGAEIAVRVYEVQSLRTLTLGSRSAISWDALTTPSWSVRQELRPLTTLRVKSGEGGPAHELRINSYGLRGPEVEVPKPPEVYRVLCLGDESLLGAQHAEAEHLCARLQASLQQQTKLKVEVCNAGVPGACPLTEYLLLTHRLAALQPDLVVMVVQETDLTEDVRYRRYARYDADGVPLACRHATLSRKPRTNLLSAWRQEFRLIDLGLHWAGDTWKKQTELEGLSDAEQSLVDLDRLSGDRAAIDHALQPLGPLADWCRKAYVTFCVLHVSSQHQHQAAHLPVTSPNPLTAALQESASTHQFLYVAANRNLPATGTRRDGNWSSEEHRMLALQLGERLIAETAGPWSSPYFQPERQSIAPVSLEVNGDRSRRNLLRR